MPVTITPSALLDAIRAVGRARLFILSPAWDIAVNIALTPLGDVEGDVAVNSNDEFHHLTAGEVAGPAKLESYLAGSDPVVTLPIWNADPALRATLTPVGLTGGAGFGSRRQVKYHTLVLFPEELFRKADGTFGALAFNAGAWTVGGVAATTRQLELIDKAVWLWKGYFTRPPIEFKHADGGKTVSQASFQCCLQTDLPEGEMLYTVGDPADVAIDIAPV